MEMLLQGLKVKFLNIHAVISLGANSDVLYMMLYSFHILNIHVPSEIVIFPSLITDNNAFRFILKS